jgi:outer membrane immunogenic protein
MKKLVLAVAAVSVLLIGAASAADLPARTYSKAPVVVPPPVFSWTGFYVGLHGGGDWFNNSWDVPVTPINILGGCGGCPLSAGSHSGSSWLGGAQAGFNYQMGTFVWGAEADGSWTNLRGSNVSLFIPPTTDNTKTDYFGTVAARFGIAWDRALLYVKGGGAWAHDQYFTVVAVNPTVAAQSTTDTRWGWMIGAGAEYAFTDNWSVKGEYNHLDFGTRTETLQPAGCVGCLAFQYNVKQTIDLVKVGVNYKFGWAQPVVARY